MAFGGQDRRLIVNSGGDKKLLRGASWGADADSVRLSSRKWSPPTDKIDFFTCPLVWNADNR